MNEILKLGIIAVPKEGCPGPLTASMVEKMQEQHAGRMQEYIDRYFQDEVEDLFTGDITLHKGPDGVYSK